MSDVMRLVIAAYKLAYPKSSPVVSLRILTRPEATKNGDIYLFLSDPGNPGFTHAEGSGFTEAEAWQNLQAHLARRLEEMETNVKAQAEKAVAAMNATVSAFSSARSLLTPEVPADG